MPNSWVPWLFWRRAPWLGEAGTDFLGRWSAKMRTDLHPKLRTRQVSHFQGLVPQKSIIILPNHSHCHPAICNIFFGAQSRVVADVEKLIEGSRVAIRIDIRC